MKKTEYTANQVAKWMLEEVKDCDCVYLDNAVSEMKERFGKRFTYYDENGNLAIQEDVLAAFWKLAEDSVVWNRKERYWRLRDLRPESMRLFQAEGQMAKGKKLKKAKKLEKKRTLSISFGQTAGQRHWSA